MTTQTESKTTLLLHESIDYAINTHNMRMEGSKPGIVFIVSPPGAGKSEMIAQRAKECGIGFVAYEPGLERPEKFGGIPITKRQVIKGNSYNILVQIPTYSSVLDKEGKKEEISKSETIVPIGQELQTEWSIPQLICEVRSMSRSNAGKGVLVLFDDWHLCSEDIQAIAFELFTHYSLNGHEVPQNVSFVLAGNASSSAGARLQFSAVRNRCMVLHTIPDPNYWLERYAIPNNIHNTLLGFFNNPANHQYLHEEESVTEQFGSPRSWTNFSHHMNYIERTNPGGLKKLKDKNLRALLEGCVSKKAASEFMLYYKIYSKIDVSKYFDKGDDTIPEEPVQKFALGSVIAHELYARKCADYKKKLKTTPNYVKNFNKILRKLLVKDEEIAMKTLIQIALRREDKDKGLISGVGLLTRMASDEDIDIDILRKLPDITNIMSIGSGV